MNDKIGIIGLGYVGLPLAKAFCEKFEVVGYDINSERVEMLGRHIDYTGELDASELKVMINDNSMIITSREEMLADCNIYIVTVPTPVTSSNIPDLSLIKSASRNIGKFLRQDDIVIYESTVYPGVTEDVCAPILEASSGLKFNVDFFCGYSPERINPGDKNRDITQIVKVTSGSNTETSSRVDELYKNIITAGTYKAKSIKTAEAAKVIENTQRDINIAFVNELAVLFKKLNLDTNDVLDTAATKWNFLNFRPGLVGGHCIGVDPYYLAYKSAECGHNPELILAGRRRNDSMGQYIASRVIKLMIKKKMDVSDNKVLILGLTFKENCPDVRNSKVFDIISELQDYGTHVTVCDPYVKNKKFNFSTVNLDELVISEYSGVILCVAHNEFKKIQIVKKADVVVFDVKGFWNLENVDERL